VKEKVRKEPSAHFGTNCINQIEEKTKGDWEKRGSKGRETGKKILTHTNTPNKETTRDFLNARLHPLFLDGESKKIREPKKHKPKNRESHLERLPARGMVPFNPCGREERKREKATAVRTAGRPR